MIARSVTSEGAQRDGSRPRSEYVILHGGMVRDISRSARRDSWLWARRSGKVIAASGMWGQLPKCLVVGRSNNPRNISIIRTAGLDPFWPSLTKYLLYSTLALSGASLRRHSALPSRRDGQGNQVLSVPLILHHSVQLAAPGRMRMNPFRSHTP